MKKLFIFLLIFITVNFSLFSIIPRFYGARSLSLGYASVACSFDINSIFVNPSLLSSVSYPISGYQYSHSYLDYKNYLDDLKVIISNDLKNFTDLKDIEKENLFVKLKGLFDSKHGIYGFKSNDPGFITKDYGFSVSFVNTAVISPNKSDVLSKKIGEISNIDIASLNMNFIGLKYTKYSLAYSFKISKAVSFGVGLHLLKGKSADFNSSITNDIFSPGSDSKAYLEHGWKSAEHKFTKIVTDLSFAADIGKYFKLGVIIKNVGNPKLSTNEREIVMEKRVIAGLAFRPDMKWGIYFDMDVLKSDLLFNGEKMQPVSFGIERGFFYNKFFLRAGFLSDLTEPHFLGKKSNILYGLGLGFNIHNIIVDLGLGIDHGGKLCNLAISGMFILK